MNTSELQTKYYLETSRESVDEKGDFTDHYVAWLQDIIIGRNKVKNLAQPDVRGRKCRYHGAVNYKNTLGVIMCGHCEKPI